jgi:uncharacterized protein YaaW (UPF0174 family)
LVEVADFVIFLKQRTTKAYDFKEYLKLISKQQTEHLEHEFKNFDKDFPKE